MLISVIIPVYNAEKYLKRTIDSVINQSIGFDNIELILVDDNSSDNSKMVIEEYCGKYPNIVGYYSKNNHGFPGFGRNMGVKLATSKYVMFLDNDDGYDKDICKNLYEVIVDENVDMVSCGRIFVEDFGEFKDSYYWIDGKYCGDYIIFEDDEILSFDSITIWNKIFKKDIIDDNNLKFLENSSADDFAFSVDYHSNCKKIIHLKNYYGYLWNIRDESLSHDIQIDHIIEVLQAYKHIVNKNKYEIESSKVFFNHMVFLLVSKCSYLNATPEDFKKLLNDIYDFENNVNVNVKLTNKVFNIANILILHKKFLFVRLYFKIINYFRKSSLLNKIIKMVT